ncbi:hypothetical protein LTR36_004834 [Oleoguttula mirabilis]|uniref:Uncharacterized protein n=1 Tax=Oleoguttula mirabilis TaxID=1507867 RepID=A0AAV9JFH2_9PEZI|nr:hypothetical protein LTR36_004834 [Oleoguttula mirabilis]
MSKTGQQTSTDVRLHVLGRVWHKHSCLATIAKVLRVMGIAEFLRKTGLEVGIITTIREDTEHGQQSTTALREYAITAELYGEGISGTSGAGLVTSAFLGSESKLEDDVMKLPLALSMTAVATEMSMAAVKPRKT